MSELRVTRRFTAPRDQVFHAWTDADVLRRWWAAQPNWDCPAAEVDLRPGGRYRLSMRDTDSGEVHTVTGEYREVVPPERLVYTWTWDDPPGQHPGSADTLVVVEFADDGEGTVVVLTHSGFADDRLRDLHAHGWNGCLDSLEGRVLS